MITITDSKSKFIKPEFKAIESAIFDKFRSSYVEISELKIRLSYDSLQNEFCLSKNLTGECDYFEGACLVEAINLFLIEYHRETDRYKHFQNISNVILFVSILTGIGTIFWWALSAQFPPFPFCLTAFLYFTSETIDGLNEPGFDKRSSRFGGAILLWILFALSTFILFIISPTVYWWVNIIDIGIILLAQRYIKGYYRYVNNRMLNSGHIF